MGLFDTIKGSLGGALGQTETSVFQTVIVQVFPNGVQEVLDQLEKTGFGGHVSSWLGNGPNQPISVDQLRSVLSNEQVSQLAQSVGVPMDKVLGLLSTHLPTIDDQQSPQGVLQPAATTTGEAS